MNRRLLMAHDRGDAPVAGARSRHDNDDEFQFRQRHCDEDDRRHGEFDDVFIRRFRQADGHDERQR